MDKNWFLKKIFMKFRKLASYPCGLMTGTPPWLLGRRGRNRLPKKLKMLQKTVDKCAKKTNICCCLFPNFFVSVCVRFPNKVSHPPLWPWVRWRASSRQLHWINLSGFFFKSWKVTMDQLEGKKVFTNKHIFEEEKRSNHTLDRPRGKQVFTKIYFLLR